MRTGLKTVILPAVLAIVALGTALFGSSSPTPASAGPDKVVLLNSSICVALGVAFGGLDPTSSASDCQNMGKQYTPGYGSMQDYVRCLRGYYDDAGTHQCLADQDPDFPNLHPYKVLPSDLASLDLDRNQIHPGTDLLVFLFVNDDAQVRFVTDKGKFLAWGGTNPPLGQGYGCNDTNGPPPFTGDPDCDGNPTTTPGDGVVVALIRIPQDEEPGTGHIVAIQEGVGIPIDFTVVGVPDTITMTPLFGKNIIQTGATEPPAAGSSDPALPTDCKFGASLGAVLDAIAKPEQTIVVIKALDDNNNEVVGSLFEWDHVFGYGPGKVHTGTPETPQGGVALPQTPTVDLGSVGIGFVQFVCGGQEPGDLKLSAHFVKTTDGNVHEDTKKDITITVIGPPASMTLAVDPPVIACDGSSSSKVSATVKTADGENAANGADVKFDVQVLGTAKPIVADTTAGVASTVVTPLSGAGTDPAGARGVPVIVTAGDVQSSILVGCSDIPAPAAGGGAAPSGGAGAGAGAPRGTIGGPDTGSGGADAQGSLSWWPVLGLAAAGIALVVTRRAVNRRS